eukprot:6214593-Pleurochrysis_carterae.AAC.4
MSKEAVLGVDMRQKFMHSTFGMAPKVRQENPKMEICKIPSPSDNTIIHCATEMNADCLSPQVVAQCKAYQFHARTPASSTP